MQKIQLWTAEEMAEIVADAQEIRTDPSLLIRNDGIAPRPLGIWEGMRLAQDAMIRCGDIWG